MDGKIEKLWAKAEAFDMDHVAVHLANEKRIDVEEVRSWIPELKRWLVLLAHNPTNDYVIFGPVDELWHAFICYTRDYARFCNEVVGFFIHHVPAEKSFEVEKRTGQREETGLFVMSREAKTIRKSQIEGYRRTLDDYRDLFLGHQFPPIDPASYPPFENIWPRIIDDGRVECQTDSCCGGSGCGCIPRP